MRPPRMGHVSTHLSGLLDRLGQVLDPEAGVREAFRVLASGDWAPGGRDAPPLVGQGSWRTGLVGPSAFAWARRVTAGPR